MANFFQKTSITPARFVDAMSRYRASTVVYYGEDKILTFSTYKRRPPRFSGKDKFAMISAATEFRPDLMAFNIYGISHLWWKILEVNGMKDITDFKKGITVRLPEFVY